MLKLGKFGLALALGLMMSLSLLAPGAFAQSVTSSHTNASAKAAVATSMVVEATQAVQQQATRTLSERFGGRGGFGRGGFGFRRDFGFRRGWWGGGWGGWGGGWGDDWGGCWGGW